MERTKSASIIFADEQFAYDYDNIGNREEHSDYDGVSRDWDYNTNQLNQYFQVLTDDTINGDVAQGYRYDADGNLIEGFVAGDADGDGTIDTFDTTPFAYAIANSEAVFYQQYPNGNYWACDTNGDGNVDTFDTQAYIGLLTGYNDGAAMFAMKCTWDAENRLIGVEPLGTLLAGQKRLALTYDYRGRRARKQVETYAVDPNDPNDGSWEASADIRFVYDDWRVRVEVDCLDHDGGRDFPRGLPWSWDTCYGLGTVRAEARGSSGCSLLNDLLRPPIDDRS